MPANFVDVVRGSYDALARGDVAFLIAHADPEIEIVEPPELPGSRTYRGHEGLAESLRNRAGAGLELDVERVIDAGRERVIVVTRERVDLHTGRDGKDVRWEMFGSLDDAFAAIGLRKLKGET
jgi:ketosteroid isomerase-like protein